MNSKVNSKNSDNTNLKQYFDMPKDILKIDSEGNKLWLVGNTLSLELKNKTVKIGFLHNGNYYKEEREADRFRKTNAWSVNFEILRYVIAKDGVINYRTETAVYRIPATLAKKHGSFLHFKTAGVERKLYIPIKYWAQEPIQ